MAPDSSTLAWKIPWMEEPGRLQSMGLLGVGHDWTTSLSIFTFMHWRRKWQPTPVFLPGESQGWGSLVGCHLWGSHRVGHYWSDLAAAATTGIPSHSLALLTAMLPKAHLSSHSKMSGSGWLTTPSYSSSLRSFFVQFFHVFFPSLLDLFSVY